MDDSSSSAGDPAFLDTVTPYRKRSQESSPPPSPTSHSREAHHADRHSDKNLESMLSLPRSASAISAKTSSMVSNVNSSRSRLQEAPPSPPISLFVMTEAEGRSPATANSSPIGTRRPSTSRPLTAAESTTSSFKDKFTRVFRAGHRRVSSESSWKGGFQRHRKDSSNSTNTTFGYPGLTNFQTTASSKTSLQEESDSGAAKQAFYNRNSSSTSRPVSTVTRERSYSQGGTGRSGRRVMHGGEVRIEIIQQNRTMAREADPEEGDGSTKYYEYYTRSNPSMPEQDENEYGDEDIMEPVVPTQMLTPSPRPGTNVSMDTESSHERKFVEDSMAEEFGGLNFEVSDLPTAVVPARANSDTSSRPVMDSRKPSSSVLSFDQNSRSQSSLARKSTGGSRRPVLGRDLSSSSYIINGRKISGNGGGLNPSEEVSQELRRLSKISAGSGVSGLAIVFTADGPASTHSSDDDDEDSFEGHRWTREEKGKARAASSEPSATHDQRSHTRTLSEHSEHAAETDTHQTDDNHDDSKSLLPVVPKIIQHKKLQAQKPNKEVLVHQGDPKYEFTYRMRQTSDDKPVLIPQYRYDGQLSFPHRNALIPPALAMPPRSPDGIVYSESSLGNRIGGSILKRPPSAVLRTPTSEEFDLSSIPQGDYTYDGRPRTSYTENYQFATPLSKSHNDMDSLIHPALRNLSEPVKTREVVSMGSVEVFGSGFRGSPFRPLASQDEISIIRDSAGQPQDVAFDNNLLQPPPQAKHTSRFIGQFPVRPKVFLRRSLTPHLYRPQDIAMTDPELQGESGVSYRQRQKTIGRLLLVCCILFPPLWFVMACGGFDSFVVTWTNGNVRGVGGVERKIALALAVVVAVGTVIGVVIGLTTASSVG